MIVQPEKDYMASKYVTITSILGLINDQTDYGKVFYKTNEDLLRPYTDIDFFDKDVLSVLSSGDHVLTARYLEANQVDAFDRNKLTLYYFYLRLWSIRYNQELYPPIIASRNYRELKELVEKVEPSIPIEETALNFFKKHLQDRTNVIELFFPQELQPKGETIFRKAKDLKYDRRDFTYPELDFYNYNMFQEIENNKKYDIVLMSNILEWAQKDSRRLHIASENLSNLLKENSIVLCSRLIYKEKEDIEQEKEIFKTYFEYEPMGTAYVYRRK